MARIDGESGFLELGAYVTSVNSISPQRVNKK